MKRYESFWNKRPFLIVSLFLIGIWVFTVVSIYVSSKKYDTGQADSIVVLGTRQIAGVPSPVFKARLDKAYELYLSARAPLVIITGGIGKGENISEAEAGKNYLHKKGINSDVLFIENKGKTTWQSLNNILPIIKDQKINKIILVSDDFHSKRLRLMTNDLGLDVIIAPVTNGPIQKDHFVEIKYILRESLVCVIYKIFSI